jgi:putative membrane protein
VVLAATTWTSWRVDPALLWIVGVGVLYWLGGRRPAQSGDPWRTTCFITGLAVLVIAVASPVDALAGELLWVHMTQHVLLLLIAPPLLALSRPWNRIWHGLPLSIRRGIADHVLRGGPEAPLRRAASLLGTPVASLVIFNVTVLAWHLPFAYEATLHSPVVHALQHATFFGAGLLFWTRVIDSPPFRSPLDAPGRAIYVAVALVVTWAFAVGLAIAPEPLYATYAERATGPGGISAIADQRIAAGIMWVPGSIPLTIAVLAMLSRWLGPGRAESPHPRAAGARS